ncbi:hypothetical protein FPZ43_17345 [Mucilaginibacter pallidiroseus]|uniref:Uncharacterized protein n=1 Tax=Mucilaginibacter pallidiroseus TaxID=2599295 RepID=A0A563U0R8_9SPHI|nr:hypothetical protein [Mucilaginibacter pallidiroseus]TWR25235.1 hypothetical protein FPZ43_17345 [Mucilaginibacter pallidiroseus]
MFEKFFVLYISVIVPATALIPLVAGLLHFGKLSKPSKIIWNFVLFSAVLNLTNILLQYVMHNTQFMLHGYTAVEFAMLSAYFACFFTPKQQKAVAVIAVLFFIGCVINAMYLQDIGAFNTYTRTLESLILIGYIIYFQYLQGNKLDTGKWGDDSNNWLSVGILIYYASSSLMFAFTNYLVAISIRVFEMVWTAHCTILAIEYILFTIGFRKDIKQRIIKSALSQQV